MSSAVPLQAGRRSGRRRTILHLIHHPVSARSFIVPLVAGLVRHGFEAQLWVEPGAEAHPALQGLPVPVRPAPCIIPVRLWQVPGRWWRLVRALRRARPLIVHAHQTRTALLPLAAACAAGVPHRIYHNHGLPYLGHHGAVRAVLRLMERINCALATDVVLVSPGNRQAALDDGLLEGIPSAVLGDGSICGIDLDAYPPPSAAGRRASRQALSLPETGFVLGWVGRPHARKGLSLVLDGWERSGAARRGGWLLLAGCSAEECRALHKSVPEGVRPLGYCHDMPALYRACTAVILVSAHEGMSYALLEGGAAGCALIGSDIPGTRDVVRDQDTGIVVAQDPDAVAMAITALDTDRALCQALGRRAREQVIARFDRRRVMAALLRHYAHVLGGRRGR